MTINKNIMLDKFSHSISNDESSLKQYCEVCDIPGHIQYAQEFRLMQKDLIEHVRSKVEEDDLFSPDELAELCSEFCRKRYLWIDNVGIHALNRWLVYTCRSEGISN